MEGAKEYYEYRGVNDAVYAKITEDSGTAYTTGEVKSFAGVSEISRKTETSSETHYYDNIPAIVVNATGADEVTVKCSAIPMQILADLTGQDYDPEKGMLIEGERKTEYFAFGYKTQNTSGQEVYVWRLKGTFSIPDATHSTQDDGTGANGQEITYTGISTTHRFSSTGKRAKAINVNTALDLADVSTFFDAVTTPDTLRKKGETPVS